MNKITRYKSLAMAALLGGFWLTSCDSSKDNDFVDYYPGADAGGVYIPGDAQTSVAVTDGETNYSVLIYRGASDTQLTVPVTVTPVDEEVIASAFNFANSVTFEVGSLTAPLNFTCDPTMLPIEVEQQFIVEIDPKYATVYGPESAVISIQREGPWSYIGAGYYSDYAYMISEYNTTSQVDFYQSDNNPNRFRITNPYKFATSDRNAYFEFEVMKPGDTILGQKINSEVVYYPDFDIESGVYLTFPGTDPTYLNPSYWTGNIVYQYQENGLPAIVVISPIFWLNGQKYPNFIFQGPIEILFPGVVLQDVNVSVVYDGMLINPNGSVNVLTTITLGADVTSAKVAVVPGATVSNETVSAIINGSIASQTIRNSGQIYLDFDPNSSEGKYSVVAISYTDDEPRMYNSASFTYTNGSSGGSWKSLGYITYTDAYMCSIFVLTEDNFPYQYDVEIQENSNIPGYYRLVNPYGPNTPFGQYSDVFSFDTSQDYYLYIDASDPDVVSIPESPQGLYYGSYGNLICSMMAYYWLDRGESQSTLIDYGYYGMVDDGEIFFYATTLAAYIGNNGPIQANCILLPNASEDPNAPNEDVYYGDWYDGRFVPYYVFSLDLNEIYSTPQTRTTPRSASLTSTPKYRNNPASLTLKSTKTTGNPSKKIQVQKLHKMNKATRIKK